MIISVFDTVENIVGKRENAVYQHFLLFPQCFEKASFPDRSKGVIVWELVKPCPVKTNFEKPTLGNLYFAQRDPRYDTKLCKFRS